MKNKRVVELSASLNKRKRQNTIDYEFKHFIRETNPRLYMKASCHVHDVMERKRIIKLIRHKIRVYREKAKYNKKFGLKILALHEILSDLGEECE